MMCLLILEDDGYSDSHGNIKCLLDQGKDGISFRNSVL